MLGLQNLLVKLHFGKTKLTENNGCQKTIVAIILYKQLP